MEEPWAALDAITINASSETVDILDVPLDIRVTVVGGNGTNTVNVGSADNQLSTIDGTVEVGTDVIGSLTSLNINDQGDTASSTWTIGAQLPHRDDVFARLDPLPEPRGRGHQRR